MQENDEKHLVKVAFAVTDSPYPEPIISSQLDGDRALNLVIRQSGTIDIVISNQDSTHNPLSCTPEEIIAIGSVMTQWRRLAESRRYSNINLKDPKDELANILATFAFTCHCPEVQRSMLDIAKSWAKTNKDKALLDRIITHEKESTSGVLQ